MTLAYKRISAGIFGLFLMFGVVFAIPRPTQEFYVNDFANILPATSKSTIQSRAVAIYEEYGAQVVIVTVPSLDGQSIEDYANALFNSWGIGDKKRSAGVLLLVAPNERQMRIEVGYGLEGALTDGTAGYIQDTYILPHFRRDNFSQGVINGFVKISEAVSGELTGSPPPNNSEDDDLTFWIIVIGILTLLYLVKSMAERSRRRKTLKLLSQKCELCGGKFIDTLSAVRCMSCGHRVKKEESWANRLKNRKGLLGKTGRFVLYLWYLLLSLLSFIGGSSRSGSDGHSGGGGRSGGGGASRRF